MKRFITITISLLLAAATFAQSVPQTVNFSATVRDANNVLLANTPVNVRLTFYENGEGGTPVYCALHQTTTNANGFMSFQLNRNVLAYACNGAPNTPFEEIPWENGNYWMLVEYQTQIGGEFMNLGYLELTSGFYAFSSNYALVAQKLENFDIDVEDAQDGDVLVYNGTTHKWEARRPGNIGGGFSPFSCSQPTGSVGGYGYVDLGLPSGTLWATCNVGATTPEDYGNYYAWGETTVKETYTSDNYTYSSNSATLPASADAATVVWGEGWRMPTNEEFSELVNYCYAIWTNINGVTGSLFTGPNGNSIFLPAAGRYGSGLNNDGSYGYYWSSSLHSGNPDNAWQFLVSLREYTIYYDTLVDNRYIGYTVRAVCLP